ncbi:phage major capsid protein, P2 family [Enterovibrio sp. ZSDZ42]|uniref:Phage major capsid protein, P2 family n=1 Tax=Enterovibrio gelatinilyticus TaxID=2899819 RepID=A0ABT5QWY2_9GAMM|nr:phage major capsid protein, P2 family [Enterovibrio sp. ZSDZ42]MDD1792528.1 phage major capsid protein, P2 family [Enterovibrio sp. ZSDZ42]
MLVTNNPEAEKSIENYFSQLKKSGIGRDKYSQVTAPQETALRRAMQASDAFLKLISFTSKQQVSGQTVYVGGGDLLTGRTATGRFRRKMGVHGTKYEMAKQDSNAFVDYEMLTDWANAGGDKEFIKLMNESISKQFALDVLRIGFHGTSVAANTDPEANPNGEDINKGWLKVMKEQYPDQVLPSIVLDPTGVAEGSYKNLDAIVKSMLHDIIEEPHNEDADLVVLVARDLVSTEQARLAGEADKPSEQIAAQLLSKSIGGLPAYIPPYFKSGQIWVTSLKNLHAMSQSGTQKRKTAQWEDDEAGIETSWLRMAAYGVDNHKKFAAIEAVTSPAPAQ